MRVQGAKNKFVLLAFKASALCLKYSTAESKHEKMRKKMSHLSVSSITDASIQQSQRYRFEHLLHWRIENHLKISVAYKITYFCHKTHPKTTSMKK